MATDGEWFESNVKHDVRGDRESRREAPLILEWSCTWSSPTEATCVGDAYDNAEVLSNCGYSLLPCGPFDIKARATCRDPEGRECDAEMELIGRP